MSTTPETTKNKKPGRPPNHPETTRERLVKAAAATFNSDGYFNTNSNKIAKAAGFAPATFYKYFTDKKEIFLEAYSLWVSRDWTVIEETINSKFPANRIAKEMIKSHLKRHIEWTNFRRSMHALIAIDEDVRSFHLHMRNTQLDLMATLLKNYGAPDIPREQLLYSFLCIERALNAVTDEDLKALKINRKTFISNIENDIIFLLTGKRGRSK